MVTMRMIFVALMGLVLVASPAQVRAAADATAPANAEAAQVTDDAEHPVEAAEEHQGLPQLNVHTYPSQIFWLAMMFVVLYVSFSRAILPMIGGVVEGRDGMVKGNLNSAQAMRDQAEAIKAAYEKSLENARARAVQAVQDVENAAKQKAADQADTFRKKAESDLSAAEERVLAVKGKAMGEMTAVAADVASIAAEKITGISTDRQKAHAIVETIASKAKAA